MQVTSSVASHGGDGRYKGEDVTLQRTWSQTIGCSVGLIEGTTLHVTNIVWGGIAKSGVGARKTEVRPDVEGRELMSRD